MKKIHFFCSIPIYFAYRFSITGTSTACKVFGRRRDPGFSAPHPAAHPNLPKKSSFFSGKQIGAAQKKKKKALNKTNKFIRKMDKKPTANY